MLSSLASRHRGYVHFEGPLGELPQGNTKPGLAKNTSGDFFGVFAWIEVFLWVFYGFFSFANFLLKMD